MDLLPSRFENRAITSAQNDKADVLIPRVDAASLGEAERSRASESAKCAVKMRNPGKDDSDYAEDASPAAARSRIVEKKSALEAELAPQWHEAAFAEIFFAPRTVRAADSHQALQFVLADWRDQTAARR